METLEPRIIKTDDQYRHFLAEVERLTALDPDVDSAGGVRLELLAKLVEDYEKSRFTFARPDPIDAIIFRMEQQGLRQKDIAPLLGGKNRASEVLSRKRSLTLPMIRALYEKLDLPPALLIREPKSAYSVTSHLAGYEGFVNLRSLLSELDKVPDKSGVYVVVRRDQSPPRFVSRSPAGRFKGRDPSRPVESLLANWVSGADIIYVGKAGPSAKRTLRRRIRELLHFGSGKPVGHSGGRALWQLEGVWDAQIAWKVTSGDPREIERRTLAEFKRQYGRFPYANFQK